MPPRSRQEDCQESGFQIFFDKMRSGPEKSVLKCHQRSAESRSEIFSHTSPDTEQAVGGTCRVAIRSLRGGEGHAGMQPGSFPKGLELALAERWLH